MAKSWNVSNRSKERNAFGLTLEETEDNAREIKLGFLFSADSGAVYSQWRQLAMQHRIAGVQIHDAQLAAAMYAHDTWHSLFRTSAASEGLLRFIRTASKRL